VGVEGVFGQHPFKTIIEPPLHVKDASAIATAKGALIAAVTDKELIVFSMSAAGETAQVERISTPASSATWAGGENAPWLVWSDADGIFATAFSEAGKRSGQPITLAQAAGKITSATMRGKQPYAIAGNQLVSSSAAVTVLKGPPMEIVSTFLGEGYAWFVWRRLQGTPGGPLSLTQVPLK
jgi:hypothetical protein